MIIVTGTSRGIGNSIALRLMNNGKHVVGLARTKGKLGIDEIECDVSNYHSVKEAAKTVKKMGQAVEAVINAAGIASMNLTVTTDEATVNRVVKTNLNGAIYCCQLFAPLMFKARLGLAKCERLKIALLALALHRRYKEAVRRLHARELGI